MDSVSGYRLHILMCSAINSMTRACRGREHGERVAGLKGIAGINKLIVLGWTVFVLGLAALFSDPLVVALLAIAGVVQISGGMITEALNRNREASAVLVQQTYLEAPVYRSGVKSRHFVDTETHGFVDSGSQCFVHSFRRLPFERHRQQPTTDNQIPLACLLPAPRTGLGIRRPSGSTVLSGSPSEFP